MHYFQERPRDFFRGEVRSTRGGLVRGSPRGGFRGAEPPDAGEVFKKFVKINEKFSNFFKFPIKFRDFFKIFLNFMEFLAKIWITIYKIKKYAFVGGSGGGAPRR